MGFIRGPQRCEEGYRKRQRQHLVTSCVGSFGPTATEFRFTLANLILLHLDVNLPALVRRVGSGARSLGGADQRPAPRSPSRNQRPAPRAPGRPEPRPRGPGFAWVTITRLTYFAQA